MVTYSVYTFQIGYLTLTLKQEPKDISLEIFLYYIFIITPKFVENFVKIFKIIEQQ